MASHVPLRVLHSFCPARDYAEVRRTCGAALLECLTALFRILAITRGSRLVASCFAFLILTQFIFGMYLTVLFSSRPGRM
jgi:hypothetical protein